METGLVEDVALALGLGRGGRRRLRKNNYSWRSEKNRLCFLFFT